MRWDAAVAAWLVPVAADSVVQGILGVDPEFNMAGEGDFVVPSLEYTLLAPDIPHLEVYWRSLVQLDMWAKTIDDVVTLEKALVRLLHLEVPASIGSIPMWSRKVGGESTPLPGAVDGVWRRSIDVQLTYLRDRWSA